MWFNKSKPKTKSQTKNEKRILNLESELEAAHRIIEVLKTENENLCCVIARDRQRIQSETAAYARKQAEAEGMNHEHQFTDRVR